MPPISNDPAADPPASSTSDATSGDPKLPLLPTLPTVPALSPRERSGLLAGFRASNLALSVALLAALALLLGVVNWHYPLSNWLVWRYARALGLAAFWAASCLGCGYRILEKLRISVDDRRTEAVLAFPAGVLAYQVAMFVLGLCGVLGVVTFVLLPTAFLALGARRLAQVARLLSVEMKPPQTFPHLAVVLFGAAGVGLLYFQILSPEALHWDARWYHLPLAQQYALDGAVRPSPERWWLAGYPHSASLLYAWAFLMPNVQLFDRIELCLHLEFVVFLATLASIPTLVRHFAPALSGRGTWAAIFLFPGIFLYDSNLCGAADHIAALWCIPITLTLIRLWHRWRVPEALLFGLFMGAGLASKYSVWAMLFFPGLLFLARGLGLAVATLIRRDRPARDLFLPLAAGAAAILIISAQHWLKNWLWYGDPFYPIFHDVLKVKPWAQEASASYRLYKSFAFPPLPGMQGVRDALQAMFTFAFIPNDWPVFHRNVPVFGFLFTLSMFCLFFIRAKARLWVAYAAVMIAIFFWYLITHQDRYLQAWLPVMTACTMATLGLVWARRHLVVRGLVAALVAFQLFWGGDVPFFPTHNLINDSPIRLVSNFLASGFLKTPNRFRLFGDEGLVGESLPRNAVLLMHELNPHLGFGVRGVSDQWQGRISYAALASPAAIHREFADMKVTHMVWEAKMSGWNSVGHDLAFLGYALNYGLDPVALGQLRLARSPATPPAEPFNDQVAVLACANPYPNGLYKIGKLTTPDPGQPWATPEFPIADVAVAVRQAGFLVVDPACMATLPPEVGTAFHPPVAILRAPLQMYVRRR